MTDLERYLSHLQRFGIRPGLERIGELLRLLGAPQNGFPIVLVGGTNGKGSTCEFLARALCHENRRVGLYTSPHLFRWNERIRVLERAQFESAADFAGSIRDEDFDALFETMQPHLEAVARDQKFGQPTEFETMTALGMLHFARQNIDIAVLEVGLGGKWDATNIVEPRVSVVTHVALDHCDRLGNTHVEIARDKVCIARPNRILVTAEKRDDVLQVFHTHCDEIGARLWSFQAIEYSNDAKNLQIALDSMTMNQTSRIDSARTETPNAQTMNAETTNAQTLNAQTLNALTESGDAPIFDSRDDAPDFQKLNAQTALVARLALAQDDVNWTFDAARNRSENVALPTVPGRFQVVRENPTVILDGANNPDGAAQLAIQLKKRLNSRPASRLILVLGILSDKDFASMLAHLAPLAWQIFATQSNSPRACDAQILATEARKFCARVEAIVPVQNAVERALASSTRNDVVCVTGSFYTIGEVKPERLYRQ